MIAWEVYMDIAALHRQGHSQRAIAKKLGIHRNTVKNHIQQGQTPQYQKGKRQQSVLGFGRPLNYNFLKFFALLQLKLLGGGDAFTPRCRNTNRRLRDARLF